MKLNIEHSKKHLYLIALLLLLTPAVIHVLKIGTYKELGGVFRKTEPVDLTFDNLVSHAYQDSFQINLKDNFFARAPFIRLRNQLDFWMYDTLHAGDVYYYDGQFFRFYMYNYSDETAFEGWDINEDRINKLQIISDTLKKYNTEILAIITPSKGHYYYDKVANHFFTSNRWSNYAVLDSLYKMANINYINFDEWYLKIKDTIDRPLFGSGGIHWNQYGAALAMDSVLRYLESTSLQEKIKYPDWELSRESKTLNMDMDLLNTANLLLNYKDTTLRVVQMKEDTPKNNLKTIINSDSYFDIISWTGLNKVFFGLDTEYRYYNKVNYGADSQEILLTPLTKEFLKKQDLIIIMYCIPNLTDYSKGMIDEMYKAISN